MSLLQDVYAWIHLTCVPQVRKTRKAALLTPSIRMIWQGLPVLRKHGHHMHIRHSHVDMNVAAWQQKRDTLKNNLKRIIGLAECDAHATPVLGIPEPNLLEHRQQGAGSQRSWAVKVGVAPGVIFWMVAAHRLETWCLFRCFQVLKARKPPGFNTRLHSCSAPAS